MTYHENDGSRASDNSRLRHSRIRLASTAIALMLLAALYLCLDTRLVTLRTEAPAYPAGTEQITLIFQNNMLRPVWETQFFWLQKLEAGVWQGLSLDFGIMHCVVTYSPVYPFSKAQSLCSLDIYQPNSLPAGQYRVVGEFALSPSPDDTIKVYAQFQLYEE